MKARLPKGMGGQGPQNMQSMLKQAQKMQEEMQKTQAELEEKEYCTQSGGGACRVKINGKHEILSIEISKEIVDPDDIETLQDIITAAVNDAIGTVDAASSEAMCGITGSLNIPGVF